MNYAIRTGLLKCVDKRGYIADVPADHRQVFTGHMANIIRSRRHVEKRDLVTALNQFPCRMGTDQPCSGNQNPHPYLI